MLGLYRGMHFECSFKNIGMVGAGMGTSEKMIRHCPVESPAINPKGQAWENTV